MIRVYSKLKNILIHCLRQVNYNGKKLVFEPFEKVGNLVFGMTRENAVEICGEIKRSRMYGYPIEDSFLDDFGDVHILCNKKGFLEAIELFPDMATETYSLFYHGTEVVLCIDIDLLVSQIRNITDDLKLDDDGEGYSSKNLGLRIYCPEDIVEDVLIHDRNYYLEE